ncbi:MAG: Gfo/Idh/MocA family oxidoreductase [bacterium]|nr:Gfo/Idh/MocA family oxidoreductase [bacterium]
MLKIAVLGLGWWGSKLFRNAFRHPAAEQVIGVDPSAARRQELAASLETSVLADPEEVLADPTVQAVIIATPPKTHFNLAQQALRAGKDVLITKPPTKTIEELECLTALAKANRCIFMMDSTFVYSEPVRKIKELFDQHLFSEILFIQSLRYGNDLRLHHVSRLRQTMLANGINVVEDLVFHDLAMLNYLLPEENFRPKAGHRVNLLSDELCDTAFIRLETDTFPVHIGLSWTLPERRRELLVCDRDKQLIFDDLAAEHKLKLFWIEDKREELIEHGHEEPLFRVINHFFHCIETRQTPFTDGAYMLKLMKIFQSVLELFP